MSVRLNGGRYTAATKYELCPQVEATFLGAALDFQAPFGSLTRSYERSGSTVRVETSLEVRRTDLTGSEIRRFDRFIDQFAGADHLWLAPSTSELQVTVIGAPTADGIRALDGGVVRHPILDALAH